MSRTSFLDKSLQAIARVAEQALFSEAYASKPGLMQKIDVRLKLIGFLAIIILISFLHEAYSLWIVYAAGLLLALLSRVPLGLFQKRVWLFVPLFSAAVVLPAVLNIVTPGDTLWVVCRLERSYAWGPYILPAEISVTRQGLMGAVTFVSRVAASVSFAVLFTLTTRWNVAFSGLRALFVPRIFVITLGMTERYIFVFLRLIQDMYRARKSRTLEALPAAQDRNWTASRIGVTFRKSLDMSEDIYRAMLSRGFSGEFRSPERFHAGPVDCAWLVTVLAFSGIVLVLERGFFR
ncbi:MAG TPA: cobalt ECF transporter T component CbiQ [Nitrospirota bacterium]|nr:cobalt ECF transporter T component CbiQ [Nitrospirota bacterium]